MTRILCVSPSYPPRVGGGEKYAHRTNSEFALAGIAVRVLTSVPGERGERIMDGVSVLYAPTRTVLAFPWFEKRLVREEIASFAPDLLLAYGPSPYDAIAARIARGANLQYVQVYHADFNRRRPATRLATMVHNAIALRAAAAIVCTNEAIAQALRARGFGSKLIVTPPGIDETFFVPHGNGGDLLFVGALDRNHAYKRLDLLLDAIKLLHARSTPVALQVAGEGDMRAAFEAQAARLGIAHLVTFLGGVSDAELTGLYRAARALILPSPTAQEGFGLVCLEAMAAGASAVCSANAGAAAIVRDAPGCAIWDGQRIESLAGAVVSAREASDAQREALRHYARAFSWQASARRAIEELERRHLLPART